MPRHLTSNDIDDSSTLDLLETVIKNLKDSFESFAGSLRKYSSDPDHYLMLLSQHTMSNAEVIKNSFQALVKTVPKDTMASKFDAAGKLFSKGCYWQCYAFFKLISKKHAELFSGINIQMSSLVAVFQELDDFRTACAPPVVYHSVEVDNFVVLINPDKKEKEEQEEQDDVQKPVAWISKFYADYQDFILSVDDFNLVMSALRSKLILACAVLIDKEARKRKLILLGKDYSPDTLFECIQTDMELRSFLSKFPDEINFKEMLFNLHKNFLERVEKIKKIDTLSPQMQRVRSLNQGLDLSVIFTNGQCVGGVRQFAKEPYKRSKKASTYTTHEEVHEVVFTRDLYLLQKAQIFSQCNHIGGQRVYFVMSYKAPHALFDESDVDLKTQMVNKYLQEFIEQLLKDVIKTSDLYYQQATISVGLYSDKGGSPHAVGFKFLNKEAWFYDESQGEFYIPSWDEAFKKAFIQYFCLLEYHKGECYFNQFSIAVILPKLMFTVGKQVASQGTQSKLEFNEVFKQALRNASQANDGSEKKQSCEDRKMLKAFQTYQKFLKPHEELDQAVRDEIEKLLPLTEGENVFKINIEILRLLAQLKEKHASDHFITFQVCNELAKEYEAKDPTLALDYYSKAMKAAKVLEKDYPGCRVLSMMSYFSFTYFQLNLCMKDPSMTFTLAIVEEFCRLTNSLKEEDLVLLEPQHKEMFTQFKECVTTISSLIQNFQPQKKEQLNMLQKPFEQMKKLLDNNYELYHTEAVVEFNAIYHKSVAQLAGATYASSHVP